MEGYSNYTIYLSFFLFLTMTTTISVQGQVTRVGFYSKTCSRAESIIQSTVQTHVQSNPKIAPGLLRMHFHDCFVQGCDASILIDGPSTEKTAGPNLLLRGYEVIDDAKNQLEAFCPGVVSCADILALAARDSVSLSNGPSWPVPTGRLDGRVSLASETANLPGFTDSIQVQIQKFADKGLDIKDLVTLVGGHTIGTSACQFFRYRLYNFTTTGGPDPTIDASFLPILRNLCPANGDGSKRVALDTGSENRFDSSFFTNIRNGRGVLESDQKLWNDASTQTVVRRFSGPFRGLSGLIFNVEFSRSMVKMSNVGSNGPSWPVPTGRLDGRVSLASETANLPGFTDSIQVQIKKFADKGLDIKDLVSLVGGHTIGTSACQFFRYRLYNFTTTGGADPTIDASFLPILRNLCPANGDGSKRVALDTGSENRFDSTFFTNIRNGRGVLESDQKLWNDASTQTVVRRFSGPFRGLSRLIFNGYHTCNALPIFFLLLTMTTISVQGQGTRVGFYSSTCPRAESIIQSTVQTHVRANAAIAPGLLRMHFHDCFVQGCDASILIDGSSTEKSAGPNSLLRGYEVIDDAKTQLEAACPGVVSCADILAFAARDSVVVSGGPTWSVPAGRRDGRVSLASEASNLPGFSDSIEIQKKKFSDKGLNTQDLVTLVGGHTIGTSACQFFRYRLYNFTTTGGPDPTIDASFLPVLRNLCPENGDGSRRVALDTGSENRFDSSYFTNLRNGRGVLESDQKLWTDASTQTVAQRFSGPFRGLSRLVFNVEFGRSMVKMSNVEVKTGTEGEIRRVCSAIN
ncbi:Plant peroxidase [Macleaya cordata]|uniref:peroxidase n=1 Tax=Macleaya cordata TaxID=56857 RepID=A0A200QVZ9_MACCD|nr:Plant peroxidase [Macleaya cordata]